MRVVLQVIFVLLLTLGLWESGKAQANIETDQESEPYVKRRRYPVLEIVNESFPPEKCLFINLSTEYQDAAGIYHVDSLYFENIPLPVHGSQTPISICLGPLDFTYSPTFFCEICVRDRQTHGILLRKSFEQESSRLGTFVLVL